MVIKVEYAEDGDVDAAAMAALRQIREKRYTEVLQREKFTDIHTASPSTSRKVL